MADTLHVWGHFSSHASLKATRAIARCHPKILQLKGASLYRYARLARSFRSLTISVAMRIRGEWGGMISVVDASRDAVGLVVEHIASARPPANPTDSDSIVSSIP